MNNDSYERFATSLIIVFLCLIAIGIIIFGVMIYDMWEDHMCYVTNSYGLTPRCDKYMRGE